jgi:hypothetical protein
LLRVVYTNDILGQRVAVLWYNKDLGIKDVQYMIGNVMRYNKKRGIHTLHIDSFDGEFNGMGSGDWQEYCGEVSGKNMYFNLNVLAAKPELSVEGQFYKWLEFLDA